MLCLAGCASTPPRAAQSTVGCAEVVLATLPDGLTDPEKHCVASAGIAMHCSRFEAWLVGYGKETRDAFGDGDASWDDLSANRIGRRCAATHDGPDALLECCRQTLSAFDGQDEVLSRSRSSTDAASPCGRAQRASPSSAQ